MDAHRSQRLRFWIWLSFVGAGLLAALLMTFLGFGDPTPILRVWGVPVRAEEVSKILLGATYLSFPFARSRGGLWSAAKWFWPVLGAFWLVLAGTSILEHARVDPELAQARAVDEAATPLMKAAFRGDVSRLNSLLGRGVDANEKNQMGFTALDYAARAIPPYFKGGQTDARAVALLLDHGANLEAAGEGGITPLMSAAANGNLELVAMLLDHGADVNKESPYGWTALAEATLFQRGDVVRFLLERGADPNAKVEFGHHQLLALARAKGDQNIVALLERAGAVE